MSASEHLSEHGSISRVLPGFAPRAPQQKMAAQVEAAISQRGVLVVEAGTGVGKTFAYLVAAILSGKRVVIATGTKNLQDQLFHEDLPVVREALSVSVTTALLKGRANYLCLHRLALHRAAGERRHRHELEVIHDWAGRTRSGDTAEMDDIEEDSFVWPLATSNTENCLGAECAHYEDCYVLKARREAQAADVVVINHHLLFADMALKERGFGDILPETDVFIIDEAHQLPEVASDFFGQTLTSRQLYNLCKDTQTEHLKESGGMHELPGALAQLEKCAADLRLCMENGRGDGQSEGGRRLPWRELQQRREFPAALRAVADNLTAMRDWLDQAAERGKGLENCHKRSLELLRLTQLFTDAPATEDADADTDTVRWADTTQRGFRLHSTPLNVAEIFRDNMQAMQAGWVFTSATLSVGDDFSHFNQSLGLQSPVTQALGSPFDYATNGLRYLPAGLPEPSTPDYTRRVCERALPVIEAAGGRTFMLFTSHRALRIAARFMADAIDYPILAQGEAPRQRLLKDFKARGNAVLLGTASFWEGVDVRGEALSCVIIDKLPFAAPGDPVLQARLEAMRKRGQNPFAEYQVPAAVVALKQGAGRLIRDTHDTGVLMLCDPRLLGKGYGEIFLRSLPPMPITRDVDEVRRFFRRRAA